MTHTHHPYSEGPDEHSPESIFEPIHKPTKMKDKLTLLKNKLRLAWQWIAGILIVTWHFFVDCYGFCRSCIVLVFRGIKRPGTFYGYNSLWFATQYGKKRTYFWRSWWDQAGKKQGVLPIGDTTLITCSAMELKIYKKARLVNKNFNPRKAIKKSYYTTEL